VSVDDTRRCLDVFLIFLNSRQTAAMYEGDTKEREELKAAGVDRSHSDGCDYETDPKPLLAEVEAQQSTVANLDACQKKGECASVRAWLAAKHSFRGTPEKLLAETFPHAATEMRSALVDNDWVTSKAGEQCEQAKTVDACDKVNDYLKQHPDGARVKEAQAKLAAAEPKLAKLREAEAKRKQAEEKRQEAQAAAEASRKAAEEKKQCVSDCGKERRSCDEKCSGLTVGAKDCRDRCGRLHRNCENDCVK
jgi:chemotaxis protein histidine kinase CheA